MVEAVPGHRGMWLVWVRAVRVFTFTASVVPVLVGAAMAARVDGPVAWWLLPFVVVASVLMHAGTNLINDCFDYLKGIDTDDYSYGGSGVIVQKLLTPRQAFIGALVTFAASCGIGLLFIAVRGWPIFALGVVGLLGGFFYTARPVGYKYFALGDALVFTLMGPLMVIGSHFVLTGSYNHAVLIASLPVGCLVAAILHANNMRDIQHDREAQVRTVANLLGHDRARFEYYGLVGGAYVAALGMIAGGLIGPWGLLVLLTVPLAARNIRRVARSQPQQPESIATLDVQTAQLHLVFGLLFALAILLGELLR
ncbi:MAG: 1,4-dihydroxy-2-naphthoate octaprenyltransferase [Sedimentisphaerales bacterium]|nr:1,4-dihydroxy-2-naphthoate octaprenyltransferase [Sedimentisphaerales bacterium]HNY78206.1 1,4-dihydroxy-2-naphthoate octaprenyltransferase [Sedimentisphaerales bacterium]HOC65369.1 1,4-dihydroxy-2-naphthoate octaprenyltransferase [Sedimentisphaerales bacterium]HOH63244.1 1,4-dihydroxy-2-naphthoate octaprenyltransferase [Sedimentisphaerales bacterium]HQA90874.1 1,4-dihydroxy-2-naphthoate octaprenyltransferase [Sedimentisphaerales bacterium]